MSGSMRQASDSDRATAVINMPGEGGVSGREVTMGLARSADSGPDHPTSGQSVRLRDYRNRQV